MPIGALAFPISVPLGVLFGAFTGLILWKPDTEYYDVELNPFEGMTDEMMKRQYDEWVNGLWQMAKHGVPERKTNAINLLKSLDLYDPKPAPRPKRRATWEDV